MKKERFEKLLQLSIPYTRLTSRFNGLEYKEIYEVARDEILPYIDAYSEKAKRKVEKYLRERPTDLTAKQLDYDENFVWHKYHNRKWKIEYEIRKIARGYLNKCKSDPAYYDNEDLVIYCSRLSDWLDVKLKKQYLVYGNKKFYINGGDFLVHTFQDEVMDNIKDESVKDELRELYKKYLDVKAEGDKICDEMCAYKLKVAEYDNMWEKRFESMMDMVSIRYQYTSQGWKKYWTTYLAVGATAAIFAECIIVPFVFIVWIVAVLFGWLIGRKVD